MSPIDNFWEIIGNIFLGAAALFLIWGLDRFFGLGEELPGKPNDSIEAPFILSSTKMLAAAVACFLVGKFIHSRSQDE